MHAPLPSIKDIRVFQNEIDGIKINYAKIGFGPPLLFIHGWTNNWEGWGSIIPYLSNKYTLYLIDLPGYGDSGSLSQYTIQAASKYLSGFILNLSQKPEAIIGMSMSSFVVADLAYSYPHLVKKIVLLGPVIKNFPGKIGAYFIRMLLTPATKSLKLQKLLKRAIDTDFVTFAVSKYLNMYKFDKTVVEKYGLLGKRKMRFNTFPDMGVSGSKYNLESILRGIKIPVLLIYGREDKITNYKFAQKKVIPENRLIKLSVIPFAGHVAQWEKPEEVASAIINFL